MSIKKAVVGITGALALAGLVAVVVKEQRVTVQPGIPANLEANEPPPPGIDRGSRVATPESGPSANIPVPEPVAPPVETPKSLPVPPPKLAQDFSKSAGLRTPFDAIETGLSGLIDMDTDVAASAITFDGEGVTVAKAIFARLPPELQERIGTPEKMWSAHLNANPAASPTYQLEFISATQTGPDTALLEVSRLMTNRQELRTQPEMHRDAEGNWRRVVPLATITPYQSDRGFERLVAELGKSAGP